MSQRVRRGGYAFGAPAWPVGLLDGCAFAAVPLPRAPRWTPRRLWSLAYRAGSDRRGQLGHFVRPRAVRNAHRRNLTESATGPIRLHLGVDTERTMAKVPRQAHAVGSARQDDDLISSRRITGERESMWQCGQARGRNRTCGPGDRSSEWPITWVDLCDICPSFRIEIIY